MFLYSPWQVGEKSGESWADSLSFYQEVKPLFCSYFHISWAKAGCIVNSNLKECEEVQPYPDEEKNLNSFKQP